MKKLYLISLLLVFCVQAFAQETFQGVVKNNENQPLLRVAVKVFDADENLLTTTFTDSEGKFVTDIEIQGRVTGIDGPLSGNHYLSLIYPNPASKGPVHFKYRSVTGEQPLIAFYTFKGVQIPAGSTISAGTYIYNATFEGTEQKIFTGLFSVLSSMKLDVQLQEISKNQDDKTPSSKNNSAGRFTEIARVRVEIIKDEYITVSEEVDLAVPENGNKVYSLNLADKPSADFQIIAENGSKDGSLIIFDGSASTGANGETLSFSWDFNDGTLGGQPKIPHIFSETGDYTITMTAVGTYGAKTSISKNLKINSNGAATGVAAVRGLIFDATGAPLAGANVFVPGMDSSFVTNDQGEIGFDGFISGVKEIMEISKNGYVTEHFPLKIKSTSGQGYFEVSLIKREAATMLSDVELGGTGSGKEGASVQFPVEALMHADGSMVTGEIEVYITPVDISNITTINAFPGQFAGITPDGEAPLILTYGVADYTLMQNGEKLQLSPGKSAIIDIPIYLDKDETGTKLAIDSEYPLWSYSDMAGVWVQEGMGQVVASNASPTGLALRGEVMHFSWWNHDVAPSPWWAVPECKIIDKNGLPTLDIPSGSSCYINGEVDGSVGPRGNPSTPNCCQPLACPPGVEIIFASKAGNGIYEGTVTKSGTAGTTSNFVIPMKRIAGYGEIAGIIAPDTTFNTAIETADNIDAFTIKGKGHVGEKMLLFVGQANGSNLQGSAELRDPDNLLIYKGDFANSKSFQTPLEIKKEGDYQLIVSGTANAPGAYTVSLSATDVIKLNTNTYSAWSFKTEIKTFFVDLKKDQLFNVALATEATSGVFTMRVLNPTGGGIFSKNSQGYMQTEVFNSSMAGTYRIEVEGISDNMNKFVLGISSVTDPQTITLDGVLTTVMDSMKVVGERRYYKITGIKGERRQFTIHSSKWRAFMTVWKPRETPFYARCCFLDDASVYNGSYWDKTEIQTLPETGEYIIEMNSKLGYNVASENWKYELFVSQPEINAISINSQYNVKDTVFYGQINELKHFTFTATAGDLINIAFLKEKDYYIAPYLRLFDADMAELTFGGWEIGVIELPTTGTYTIEYTRRSVNTSQEKYVMGLTSVEPPVAINYQTPFTAINGMIDVVGKKYFYSLQVDSLERFNIGIAASDTSQAGVAFRKLVNDKPFYVSGFHNQFFHSVISENGGKYKETGVIAMPYTGEVIFEILPTEKNDMKLDNGAYTLYIGQREIVPLALNTPTQVSFVKDLGKFNQFYRFRITAPTSNKISITASRTSAKKVYISVLGMNSTQVYRQLLNSTGVIDLPATGDYIVEVENEYGNDEIYTVIVKEEM